MRLSPFAFLAGVATVSRAQSLDPDTSDSSKATVFDGITVPPLLQLTPANFDEEIKKTRYLVIKHYSPYCPHCIDFAPKYQTAYEYYYTSHPTTDPDASFLEFYDFRFATLNCVAYYDLCVKNGVSTYPMTAVMEDGEIVSSIRGVKEIDVMGETFEEILEKAKPGTRPKTLLFPNPGDTKRPTEGATTSKETTDDTSDDIVKGGNELPAQKQKEADKAGGKADKTDKADKADKAGAKKQYKAPSSAELWNNRELKDPVTSPNPNGVSISLTAESFQRMVTMTQDPWFIKFYAPWCPHCQQLAPTWNQLGKAMQDSLNVGEVNCDQESRLCKDVRAKAYPTILFFKGGERAEYRGLRGLGDFVQYAEKAVDLASGVPDVTAAELEALEAKEEVIFVYFYDHATTSEDFAALERLPLSLIGHAKLVKTSDPDLSDRFKISTWPRLLVTREGRPTYYTPITPNAMRDVHGVLEWMKSVWLPLVPELTASNARQIMDGKIVVLGVLNREDQTSFQTSLKEMKAAANEWMDRQIQEFQLERKKLRDAKQMRVEEARDRNDERAETDAKLIRIDMSQSGHREVGFAWVDGKFWQRWIRTTYGIDVSNGESVIINDQDGHKYYDQSATGNYIMVSRTAISESLDKIIYGPNTIKSKLTTTLINKIFLDMRDGFIAHPFLSGGITIVVFVAIYSWLRSRRRARGGYFKLDETMSGLGNLKDGLLGQQFNSNNEKAD